MIDINTLISQALAAAVAQATAPLLERIAALEAQSADKHVRLRVLADRVAVLEAMKVQIDRDDLLAHLDNQEWFWNKIRHFTDGVVEQAIENHTDCWDHNDFVTEDKLDDYVQKDELDLEVREALETILIEATLKISI